jgi:hypothetical protein
VNYGSDGGIVSSLNSFARRSFAAPRLANFSNYLSTRWLRALFLRRTSPRFSENRTAVSSMMRGFRKRRRSSRFGTTVAAMHEQMLDAFSQIAAKVPPAQLIYDQ